MKVELLGGYSKEELEKRIKKVASAAKLSRFPGNVIEVLETCNDYDKNLNFIKRVIKMGHKTIIEHDYIVFALCDVSPIIEQTILGSRLASFTIKSRREVDFRNVGYYIPPFRNRNLEEHKNREEIEREYKEQMQSLFDFYGDMVDDGIDIEDARFILPYCYHSNIIMGMDARELEKMVVSFLYGNLSRLSELKELGEELYKIIKQNVPYLVDSIEAQEKNDETPFKTLEGMVKRPPIKIIDKPQIIDYTKHAEEKVLRTHVMYHYQCDEEQANEILKQMENKDASIKEKLMHEILNKTENRELEQVYYTIKIPISLAILTHFTRHRMQSLLVPEFIPMWDLNNYKIPDSIKNKGWESKFIDIVNKNIKLFEKFKNMEVAEEDLIYFYISGQMCNIITTMNARNIKWVCRMRGCNKAQWEIRNIVKGMIKEVKAVSPLIGEQLGPTCITNNVCYEGKESCGLIEKILKNDKTKKQE